MSASAKSIELIRLVAHALEELNDSSVFVGGATVPFYIPEVYWPQARPTEDVDLVLEIIGRKENWVMEERLRKKGFNHDTSKGAPLCRWIYKGLKVDVMSSDGDVFGFTNKWYKEGVEKSIMLAPPLPEVKIFSCPYFLATKIEAFLGRGNGDYTGSADMEDIISILETHPNEKIKESLDDSTPELKKYLRNKLAALKNNDDFLDAIPGAVFNRVNAEDAKDKVLEKLELILKN